MDAVQAEHVATFHERVPPVKVAAVRLSLHDPGCALAGPGAPPGGTRENPVDDHVGRTVRQDTARQGQTTANHAEQPAGRQRPPGRQSCPQKPAPC